MGQLVNTPATTVHIVVVVAMPTAATTVMLVVPIGDTVSGVTALPRSPQLYLSPAVWALYTKTTTVETKKIYKD